MHRSRLRWAGYLAAVIALGIGSRMGHTSYQLIDKYLGDALYAAMFYAMARALGIQLPTVRLALVTMALMTVIELFQLTGLPLGWLHHRQAAVQIAARLLGTEFSVADLAAYAMGIASVAALDRG